MSGMGEPRKEKAGNRQRRTGAGAQGLPKRRTPGWVAGSGIPARVRRGCRNKVRRHQAAAGIRH